MLSRRVDDINLNRLGPEAVPLPKQYLLCSDEFITWRQRRPNMRNAQRNKKKIKIATHVSQLVCSSPTMKRPCVIYQLGGKSIKTH